MGAKSTVRPIHPARGRLLVASPRLLDPNFMHTVVLLYDHGDDGSWGVVVNRRGTITVADLGSDAPLLEERRDPIWIGGPVGTEKLHVLHAAGASIPGALEVLPGVQLGGDPAVLDKAIGPHESAATHVKFIVGYAGWGEAQLEGELAEGSWVVCPGAARWVFDPEPQTLWRRLLRAQGGPVAHLADIPPDPSWN